ncbi:MAG: FliM/FliN family flagellar motor switch protein [Planctomycetota bacterium]|nr:FliM/FliN family flagellar motor switch protein [Planctomycetota bacterium]
MSLETALQSGSATAPAATDGPLGPLPTLTRRQARIESRLARNGPDLGCRAALGALGAWVGDDLHVGAAEILWRASGINRVGVTAQLAWPRLGTRLGIGIETPLAHAFVDRLLGFDRLDVESRTQVTPVEWGVWSYLLASVLDGLATRPVALGAFDMSLERVGPDPFDVGGLGPVATILWPLRLGRCAGTARLWLAESLAERWLGASAETLEAVEPSRLSSFATLASDWRAVAGEVTLSRGLARLRVGGVLPLSTRLRGEPRNPVGPVELVASDVEGRSWFDAEPRPQTGGSQLIVVSGRRRAPAPREKIALNPHETQPVAAPTVAASDIPVTLVVELGRVSLPLSRLADLKPGDVVELGRHSREPVELTSNGRLVARGELVAIDTELGVRVTSVLL